MTDFDLSVAVGPGQIDITATLYGLKSCAISNVSLSRRPCGTVGRIQVVGDGSIIGNIHHKRPISLDQKRCRIVARNER